MDANNKLTTDRKHHKVNELMRERAREKNNTVIFVSHC